MKHLLLVLVISVASLLVAQQEDSTITQEKNKTEMTKSNHSESKWYYGGNIGFSFWNNYFYLSISPLVGYKVTPQFSVGGKIGYAYTSDSSIDPTLNTSSYGGSIFTRYRIIPQIYVHGEFAYVSYENVYLKPISGYTTERNWVPFLLLGGGFSQLISPNVWAYAEILFDVINDKNSPYEVGDPFISLGVGVGF